MLKVIDVSLKFNKRTLFENVNIDFKDDNCYGVIGANGAGKSTFLKLLSGEIDTTKGDIILGKGERLSFLKQNHNAYDECLVIETVIMGNNKLYSVMKEKDALYMKPDFNDKDGIRVGELEAIFESMNGWSADSEARILLAGLGIETDKQDLYMKELTEQDKVKVLLAQAIFGDPDVLLLDEPTNGLDMVSKNWLEEFLINYKHTVILVSHDRHFLNKVCTYTLDIDREKINLSIGNYDFWYKSNELMQKQVKDSNKRKEEKIKELQDFIARFSANASKSKQATSRKKLLEKITIDELIPSNRKYPYINFEFDKHVGKEVISLEKINVINDGKQILKNFNLTIRPDDKIALIGENEIAKTTILKILSSFIEPTSGTVKIGTTVKLSYFPKNHDNYFNKKISLIDWLRDYSENKEDAFVRGFLGRMLFSGEEALKNIDVLSGGEKVRCMFSKMMLNKGNVLLFDEPTNHLDIESITSLNNALEKFNGPIVFSTYDTELIESVSNRIILIKEDGTYIDKQLSYEEFLEKYIKKA